MPELTIAVAWPSADAPEVRIAGDIDASTAGRVQMAIVAVVMGASPRSCHVDLTHVTSIDAAGLDALIVAGRYLGEHGVTMRTHNSWAVDRVMRSAGMLHRFGPPTADQVIEFDVSAAPSRRGWSRLRRAVPSVGSGAHWAR